MVSNPSSSVRTGSKLAFELPMHTAPSKDVKDEGTRMMQAEGKTEPDVLQSLARLTVSRSSSLKIGERTE